ncbi:hypothetical protein DPV78_012210 [Talaromyces pinophilus]|nr:hypothetical protein DPV78_012210 [Talaromyces pinophilus]
MAGANAAALLETRALGVYMSAAFIRLLISRRRYTTIERSTAPISERRLATTWLGLDKVLSTWWFPLSFERMLRLDL